MCTYRMYYVRTAVKMVNMICCRECFLFCKVGGDREDEGRQQFFFDQKSLDIAERKQRQQEQMMRRTEKRARTG